jgi:anhydro-N-acetylmuramic acid kinase
LSKTTQTELYIGLMSGTSVDAIDAALVAINENDLRLEHLISTPLDDSLKQALLACNQQQQIRLHELCRLQSELGQAFANSVQNLLSASNASANQIRAIGSHGQTIFHAPDVQMSLQIGHPAMIAKQTGITTIADFRIDDMALGGQGAPFAPVFHQALFAETDNTAIAVNIGGIANISVLSALNTNTPITGWDCGPGNGLIDEACQKYLQCAYDKNGAIARTGQIKESLLENLLADDYFAKTPPKSSGRDYFNWQWLESSLGKQTFDSISITDLLATLTELTAITIAHEINKLATDTGNKVPVWICGGGAFNEYLIERIATHLPNCSVQSSQVAGHNPDSIEAMLFAWLAYKRLHNQPVALSAVTGASRDAVMGGIWHP